MGRRWVVLDAAADLTGAVAPGWRCDEVPWTLHPTLGLLLRAQLA